MKSIEHVDVSGKNVILRIDTNVPYDEEKKEILDDYRLKAHVPTIQFLRENKARIILVGHLGRPEGEVVDKLRLRSIYLRLSQLLKRPIKYAPNLFSPASYKTAKDLDDGEIMGLENIRFEKGEEDNSRTMAKKLAEYGELYVNDALSVSHRSHASVEAICELMPHYAGLLLEKEYNLIVHLLVNCVRPFVLIVGGAKAEDKLPVIKNMVHHADNILTGGGVANTFLVAKGVDMKNSIFSEEVLAKAKETYKKSRGKIVLPVDFKWEKASELDIGDETVKEYLKILKKAKTIFMSGPLGKIEDPKYREGTDVILKNIAETPATTVICGGDTVEEVDRLKLSKKMTFISTGGSATLMLLSGEKLPGIYALNH